MARAAYFSSLPVCIADDFSNSYMQMDINEQIHVLDLHR